MADEFRRSGGEGHGGLFAKLPRSQGDRKGNTWTIARRSQDGVPVLVLKLESNTYAAMRADSELGRVSSAIAEKSTKAKALVSMAKAERNNPTRAAQLTAEAEELARDVEVLQGRRVELQEEKDSRTTQEWVFPADVSGLDIEVWGVRGC